MRRTRIRLHVAALGVLVAACGTEAPFVIAFAPALPPVGYREAAPARVLKPGEYRVRAVSVEQQALLEFTVALDGRIIPRR